MNKAQHTTSCIVHLADSANFKGGTSNKRCSGLTGSCLEMPNDTIHVTVGCNLSRVKEKYDILVELAVWGHLDSKTDLELILLKGHLIIEQILEVKLNRCGIENKKTFSFYSKILALEKINFEQTNKKKIILDALRKLNKLRNNLAHDFYFDLNNGEFDNWAKKVLKNMDGEKYTRYTYRTKIVHAFSTLTINILELTTKEKQYEYNNI